MSFLISVAREVHYWGGDPQKYKGQHIYPDVISQRQTPRNEKNNSYTSIIISFDTNFVIFTYKNNWNTRFQLVFLASLVFIPN